MADRQRLARPGSATMPGDWSIPASVLQHAAVYLVLSGEPAAPARVAGVAGPRPVQGSAIGESLPPALPPGGLASPSVWREGVPTATAIA